ncbi:MAG: cation:proton antiporter [Mycobacteriales bacterium]
MDSNIVVVALAVLGFGLVAGRLSRAPLTMPMLFTAGGVVLGPVLGVLDFGVDSSAVSGLAEATLVVVLFSDASRMDLRTVLREHSLALRLLGIGLPLALLIGTGAGLLLLPALPVAACALLATALAPTDAALGQAFVEDETVPARIRQTLNVESGLNDGLAVPFLTVLLDVALRQTGSAAGYALLLGRLVGVGVLVGVLVGGLGGAALQRFAGRYGMVDAAQRLATVALAALAYGGSELLGGNGFVAAFTAGLVVGTTARELLPRTQEFAETEGQLLTLLTFLLFGSVITADLVSGLDLRVVLYALASLLLVRPLAVLVSLRGSGAPPATVAYVAWAGPRGLASIVYAVVIAEATGVPGADEIFLVAGFTILVSIYLHGTSASAASARYGAYMSGVAAAAAAGGADAGSPAPGSGDSDVGAAGHPAGHSAARMEHRRVPHLPTRLSGRLPDSRAALARLREASDDPDPTR